MIFFFWHDLISGITSEWDYGFFTIDCGSSKIRPERQKERWKIKKKEGRKKGGSDQRIL